METTARSRFPGWSGIAAGAAIAIGVAWMGQLLGGWFAMLDPLQEGGGLSWLGQILAIAVAAGGLFAGGAIASRISELRSRGTGLMQGAVVWGAFATFGAFLFALLGGSVALVTGVTTEGLQLGFASSFFTLLVALPFAIAGGAAGASAERPHRVEADRRRTREVIVSEKGVPGERREEYRTGASSDETTPPSVH